MATITLQNGETREHDTIELKRDGLILGRDGWDVTSVYPQGSVLEIELAQADSLGEKQSESAGEYIIEATD